MSSTQPSPAPSPPTSLDEYEARFAASYRLSGFGIANTRVHMPCPFCGAPDFLEHVILDAERAMSGGATCGECGRGAKAIYTSHYRGHTTFELVQTSGADPDPWIPPMRRVPASKPPTLPPEPDPSGVMVAGD